MTSFGRGGGSGAWWHRFLLALAVLSFVSQSACSRSDEAADYRYRLTVEVDTPEGLRTGSSVIEVRQRLMRTSMSPAGTGVERRAKGEAVAVDLPGDRTLFALLRSDNNADWAVYVMQTLAPRIAGEDFVQQLDDMLALEGEIIVPRMFPPLGHLEERSAYPMLVTFGDIADPASVELVDPDDLAATFGEGVSLRRITVELTDDSVTTGIEERLGWLQHSKGSIAPVSNDETPPLGTPLPLHAQLTEMDFERGNP